jgi:hypothetical protein
MRAIDAGDLQRFVATSMAESLDPKTIRNFWRAVSLIWNTALAQKYVDSLPKPKLPVDQRRGKVLYLGRCRKNHCGVRG